MALTQRFTSPRFPYLPLRLQVRQRTHDVEALLDTGFGGDVTLPPQAIMSVGAPDDYVLLRMADASVVWAPYYNGTAQINAMGAFPVQVVAMGRQSLVGRGITDRFMVILDHGRQLIIEP